MINDALLWVQRAIVRDWPACGTPAAGQQWHFCCSNSSTMASCKRELKGVTTLSVFVCGGGKQHSLAPEQLPLAHGVLDSGQRSQSSSLGKGGGEPVGSAVHPAASEERRAHQPTALVWAYQPTALVLGGAVNSSMAFCLAAAAAAHQPDRRSSRCLLFICIGPQPKK